jgi:hypothetical protein
MRSLSLISHSAENANHEQEQLASWAPCCTSVLYYSVVVHIVATYEYGLDHSYGCTQLYGHMHVQQEASRNTCSTMYGAQAVVLMVVLVACSRREYELGIGCCLGLGQTL